MTDEWGFMKTSLVMHAGLQFAQTPPPVLVVNHDGRLRSAAERKAQSYSLEQLTNIQFDRRGREKDFV